MLLQLLLLLIVALPVLAEGERVAGVYVVGAHRIEKSSILNVVSTKPGDTLNSDMVDQDIRSIYKMGQFQNVTAESNPAENGAVDLIFVVAEKPILRELVIEGNKEITTEKLKEGIPLKVNSVFSEADLDKTVKKMQKQYVDEGYYLAEVTPKIETVSRGDIKVTLKMKEGKKVLIREIHFDGNKVFSAKKLRGVMETKEKWFLSWLTGAGTYKEDILKNDVNLIADFYFNNGYINVKVGEPRVKLLPDKSGLIVTIGITEGDQFRTGKIDFRGDLLTYTPDQLRAKLQLKPGEVFSRSQLRNDITMLTDLFGDLGYAFANITPLTKIEADKKIIDIAFDVEKGEKVYINRINISGNTRTRDKVLRRELRLTEGELYSATGLKKSKQNLMNTGYFEEATVATAPGGADNRLNVNVGVKEKSTGTFSVGAGYSSLDGIIGQGSVSQSNFLGLGLKANASVAIGARSQTYNLGLTDPYFLDTKWTVGGDLYRVERQYPNFTSRVTGADVKGGYPFSDELSTFWIYKFETNDLIDLSGPLVYRDARDYKLLTRSTTGSLTGSLNWNNTDYRLDPTTGWVSSISAEYAGLGGTNRFTRFIGSSTWFHPLVGSMVFSLRGTLGYLDEIRPVPRDEHFLLGGIGTLRGFSPRTVGPTLITPRYTVSNNTMQVTGAAYDYIGGDKEAILNAEVTFPLIKEAGLKGVLFMDAGNSYGSSIRGTFSGGAVLASYGGGIRWVSPIGPLRLEYGIPINPRIGIDNQSGRFEFSIGNLF